ncbi:MAG: bifunctional riboflavin kinase/FAD synthetase [Clostridia bacterium]|nr:bifunctional riboflavin kinase/FAD synthetase [Clostridia bacterium]
MQQIDFTRGTCVALGNFDGVHLGHRAILELCAKNAKTHKLPALAWSFRRHPEHFLGGTFSSGTITSLSQKETLMKERGIDRLLLEDFETVRDLSPATFCEKVLLERLSAKKVFCGFNFRFGKNGAGDADFLKKYLEERGTEVQVVSPVCLDGSPVSSTRIRNLLSQGDMEGVNALLGRPYSILFPVLHGKHLGTRMGFPTLNQAFPNEYALPLKGVYAVAMNEGGKRYHGVCNVGLRPTVDSDETILAETHLFDYSGDLYGKEVQIEFFTFLRGETRFASVEELTGQIALDKEKAQKWWKENQ